MQNQTIFEGGESCSFMHVVLFKILDAINVNTSRYAVIWLLYASYSFNETQN